jgi:type 1 glutamine amidotransferase
MTQGFRPLLGLIALAAASAAAPAQAADPPTRVLYVTHSAGYRHDVLPLSQSVLAQLGDASGAFALTVTEDVSIFSSESLQSYAAVMFYTTGELPMSAQQKAAFLDFVGSGHGFVGVHSATDTFYLWPDYLELIGGYFNDHPWRQSVRIEVADPMSPVVGFLGTALQIEDEIYQISDFDHRGSHVLLRLDPTSVDLTKGGVHRRFYGWPLAWTRSYGQGRVFYTALGHGAAVWQDPRYQQLLLNAILWTTRKLP